VPPDLPPTRADADLLRRVIANLATFVAQRSGRARIVICGAQDAQKWLTLGISGPNVPSQAALDEAEHLLSRLAAVDGVGGSNSALGVAPVGLALARVIVEFYGGSLSIGGADFPGFVVRLPAAI
jgi:K+-sensing histidine kinase KdpD